MEVREIAPTRNVSEGLPRLALGSCTEIALGDLEMRNRLIEVWQAIETVRPRPVVEQRATETSARREPEPLNYLARQRTDAESLWQRQGCNR